jgi:adenylosuccinate synthase
MDVYNAEPLSDNEILDLYMGYAKRLKPMVVDETQLMNDAIARDKHILFEGAQGALLDIDFGTYPYVTASHTITGSAPIGLGIPPGSVQRVLGVAKAYTTRVGQGPFPTEDSGKLGAMLRESGAEFGSTTGRPRRCGAFDAAIVRYAARINGAREMVLTKLDVLSEFETLKIATGYKGEKEFDPFRSERLEPEYVEVGGFKTDISWVRERNDLPEPAREYIKSIEKHTGLKVSYVSVGPERDAVIKM